LQYVKILGIYLFVFCLLSGERASARSIYVKCNDTDIYSNDKITYKITKGWFNSEVYYERDSEWVPINNVRVTDDKLIVSGQQKSQKICPLKCSYKTVIDLLPMTQDQQVSYREVVTSDLCKHPSYHRSSIFKREYSCQPYNSGKVLTFKRCNYLEK
jgi:hypothetical protein